MRPTPDRQVFPFQHCRDCAQSGDCADASASPATFFNWHHSFIDSNAFVSGLPSTKRHPPPAPQKEPRAILKENQAAHKRISLTPNFVLTLAPSADGYNAEDSRTSHYGATLNMSPTAAAERRRHPWSRTSTTSSCSDRKRTFFIPTSTHTASCVTGRLLLELVGHLSRPKHGFKELVYSFHNCPWSSSICSRGTSTISSLPFQDVLLVPHTSTNRSPPTCAALDAHGMRLLHIPLEMPPKIQSLQTQSHVEVSSP